MKKIIHIQKNDSVVIALEPIEAGTLLSEFSVKTSEYIPKGHKIAIREHQIGDHVFRYGFPIGHATKYIQPGDWIHSHNLATNLSGTLSYEYQPIDAVKFPQTHLTTNDTFLGYKRKNGKVGTRNEIWIVNTVGCVNRSAELIAAECNRRFAGQVDGFHTFSHPYGCSQLGDDLYNTQKVLAGLIRNPNAGGVLVLGLGCENNRMNELLSLVPDADPKRIRSFYSQTVGDEIEEGVAKIEELLEEVKKDKREPFPASELVLGMKCGGSDGLSGITANPLLGRISEKITNIGGTAILTEVPEMFGAEQVLMNRAATNNLFNQTVDLINDFKNYFVKHDQPVYENPSPGNKEGGITTLEEKSLGAIQKGGNAVVQQVLKYGEQVEKGGLVLVQAPGNDGVSCTAEVVAGANMILFTTGRGTPLGFPVPTIKVSTNTEIFNKKPNWIDFNAGEIAYGDETFEEATERLWKYILDTASGLQQTNNEKNGYREIAIWKEGVTL
jgi:altronate hydrolase